MSRAATMTRLRANIARHDPSRIRDWPAADLGATALNTAFPGGGLATGVLHEILPAIHGDFPAALGFGLGALARILARRPGHILWAQPAWQALEEGILYPHGLAAFGIDPDRVVHVHAPKAKNLLWTLEEALACEAFAAVVGLLPDNDRTYDFTTSRRLSMRAARHGATGLLLAGRSNLGTSTAAETRWSVETEPSAPAHRTGHPVAGLGPPRWRVSLLKSRKGASGHWRVEWNHETLSFRLAAPLADRTTIRLPGAAAGQWAAA